MKKQCLFVLLLCHELFHIMSRANPDAPKNDHCICLYVGGKAHWAIPILFSSAEKYDVKRGSEFFNYLKFQFLSVERDDNSSTVTPIYDGQKPKLIGMQQVSGFLEQAGRNTGYIIHPEEILADNFALLVLGKRNVPSLEIIKKMEEELIR